ncbi:hypothetical protein Cme02nite_37890 [Catellatospora methionotrophica]|uniref:DUF2637 domain-containing protein n=1 Tax=Catellatospora methionotrophica TaxID=121620 RepID=A0A8J3LAJ5_9ACTN|nr:hypothetical protein [Catellatospora methionotrophica]GIG15457.1 hypothetical protein Cme02nite_37890 [Catellatospora methionotrophica]
MTNIAEIWTWIETNSQTAATLAGGLIVLVLVLLLVRAFRRGGVDSATMLIAAPLVIAWEAEGIFEVLLGTDAPWFLALAGCGMTSMVMVNLGAKGHKHFKKYGTIGPNGRTVWYLAIPVGVIVAASATTASMQGLRILIPVLGATLWWSEYRPDEVDGERRKRGGSWVWTPRRIFVRWGWISPNPDDIVTLAHDRGVRRLVRAQYALQYGWFGSRSWRAGRVRRAARDANDAMVQAAHEQMRRVKLVVEMTAPDYEPPQPEQATKSADDAAETPHEPKPRTKSNPARAKAAGTTAKKWVPAEDLAAEVRAFQHRNPGASVAQAARALGYDVRHVQKTVKAAETIAPNTAPAMATATA